MMHTWDEEEEHQFSEDWGGQEKEKQDKHEDREEGEHNEEGE